MSSRSMMSRIILGVTFSASAAIGLIYLYYKTRQHDVVRQKKPNENVVPTDGVGSKSELKSPTEDISLNSSTLSHSTPVVSSSRSETSESEIVESSESQSVAVLMSQSMAQKNSAKKEEVSEESDFDRDRNSIVREVQVHRDVVAGLIGKKGSNIKEIQRKSNTEIKFKDSTLDNGDRVCQIRGSPSDVVHAESLIEKYMTDQPVVTTQFMSVPLASVGRIIGQGGTTIRSIQDASKARVNVDPKLDDHYKVADGIRVITIKGTPEQIDMARKLVLDKVEEEKSLRKRIDIATSSRTPRRGVSGQSTSNVLSDDATAPNISPLKSVGMTEIFVSCVYHPNNFWIQVMGRDSIELDKLCDMMTANYAREENRLDDSNGHSFMVGDLVAAPFDDKRMYRAKITRINNDIVNVIYVDYGDMRDLHPKDLRILQPEFLQLRFQAIEATLNLDCVGEKWSDEVIDCFCDLTYCAQWKELTGKVKEFLKNPADNNRDVIWMELLDKDLNIGEELIKRGYAKLRQSSTTVGSEQKKSYAAVASGENSPSDQPSDTLASASGFSGVPNNDYSRNGN